MSGITVELSELDADLWDTFKRGGAWVAHSEYMKLKDENAKLRELVKSMYYDLTHMTFPPDWVTDYEADMRDLGVEVDA